MHVSDGQRVEKDALLLELESPDLDSRLRIVRREIEILQLQLRRQAGRSETIADIGILEPQLAEAVAEYRGLAAQQQRLMIRAPATGVVRDLLPALQSGRWLSPQAVLARLIEPGLRLRGYLPEAQLWRVESGATGRFIADDPARPALRVRLDEVDATGTTQIQLAALTSDHQGPIAVRRNAQQAAEPLQAQYAAQLQLLDNLAAPLQPIRGVAILEGKGESVLGFVWRRAVALLVRESGF